MVAAESITAPITEEPIRSFQPPTLNPWARWGAKWIDTALYFFLLAFAFGALQYDWYTEHATLMFSIVGSLLFPFWDAMLIAMSGGSPGRAVFRFRVEKKSGGGRPSLGTAIGRAWGAWVYGCGLGIPLVALITSIASKSYLEKHGASSWDTSSGTVVLHKGPRWWSWLIFLVVVALVIALQAYGSQYEY